MLLIFFLEFCAMLLQSVNSIAWQCLKVENTIINGAECVQKKAKIGLARPFSIYTVFYNFLISLYMLGTHYKAYSKQTSWQTLLDIFQHFHCCLPGYPLLYFGGNYNNRHPSENTCQEGKCICVS